MTVIDDHTVRLTSKKDGKVVSEEKSTVGSDGTMLTEEFTQFPPAGDAGEGETREPSESQRGLPARTPCRVLARVQGRRVL